MLKIGLTGGIGAGKSTVAKIFETIGVPVYYADQEAKRLMEEDPILINKIKDNFGESAYSNGKLNRTLLAEIVFKNKDKLDLLNSLVHPFTIQDGKKWMEEQSYPYALKEAALIFESGSQSEFDFIIGVHAPVALRLSRTIKRDKQTKENITERMENQLDESLKIKLCDFILINDERQLLIPQVNELHKKLLTLSSEASING